MELFIQQSKTRKNHFYSKFSVHGQWFYASIAEIDDKAESMIFKASLYLRTIYFDDPVSIQYFDVSSRDNLRNHIENFFCS